MNKEKKNEIAIENTLRANEIVNKVIKERMARDTTMILETDDMRLPVFPNGYARQTVCVCDPKMIIPARTMIDGKWRAVCMTCGSLNFVEIKK